MVSLSAFLRPTRIERFRGHQTAQKSVPHGAVAQLGERCVRNAEVEGSTPFRSTISFQLRVISNRALKYDAARFFHQRFGESIIVD